MDERKEINLVLSGGSARGLAHIGALAVLEKHFRIKSIIGTSMGAIVGGLYALGYTPDQMISLPESLNLLKIVSMFKPSFKSSGLTNGMGVLHFLEEKTNKADLQDCRIPFAAIAYDLLSKRSVIIDKGSMASAMRASSSLPFIFQPFQYGKYLFVDGYIEHPLPIKFARYFFEEPLIVACSVLPPVLPDFEVFQPAEKEEGVDIPSMLDVFFQTNFYSQGSTVLDALVQSQPDIYITAYDSELKFWELDEVEKFYEVGKKAAEKSLEEYHSDREHTGHRKFIKHLQDRYANFRKLVKKFSD